MVKRRISLRAAPALGAAAAGISLAAACQPAATGEQNASEIRIGAAGETIDRSHPVLATRVPAGPEDIGRKFVIVRIAAVVNPRKLPLTFAVGFRPRARPEVPLGTFSLYPADRPGRFIVATQGKLAPGGMVTLAIEGDAANAGDVSVAVDEVSLGDR